MQHNMEISTDITSPGSGEYQSVVALLKKMLPDFILNIGELGPPFSNILLVFIALCYPPSTSSSLLAACLGRASNILINDYSLGRRS